MTDGAAIGRPILWGRAGTPVAFSRPARNSPKVSLPARGRQGERLNSQFTGLDSAFAEQATLTQSLGATDPQLVIVFEAIDERADLEAVARRAGLEIVTEVDKDFDPDPDFPRRSINQTLPVVGCLHAVCLTEQARRNVLSQWRKWQSSGSVDHGYAPLRILFEHLSAVRVWGPEDRVRASDVDVAMAGMLPVDQTIEIELWFRKSPTARQKAESEVGTLVTLAGGSVVSVAQIPEIGYHALKCTVPFTLVQSLAAGDYDAVTMVKSAHIMYFRVTAQSFAMSEESGATSGAAPLPTGDPVLCILDGVPTANHPSLAGRIVVSDPDDLSADSAVDTALRKHGTAISSISVWGDLSGTIRPALRPVMVRPILTPSFDTIDSTEELPKAELAPDLVHRVFRELYDGDGTTDPSAPSVVVINLSVGDPATPFDGVMSAWARAIDWLTANYGVLAVVSAGNHPALPVPGGTDAIVALTGSDRADAINAVIAGAMPRRSLLAPADAINALTIGALNQDASGDIPVGPYQFDPCRRPRQTARRRPRSCPLADMSSAH